MFPAFWDVFTPEYLLYFLRGAAISLGIACISVLVGLVLGVIACAGKMCKNKFANVIANIYVEFIRGTPLMVQILFLFSVIPALYTAVTGNVFRMNAYLVGIIALSINSGAYSTELIRSGINSIDKGQWEACETLGLSYFQTMRFVVLPQAFKVVIPPIISEFITLIKDSSLIASIGAVELLKSAQVVGAKFYEVMSPYCIILVYYLIMTVSISYIGKYIERKLAESD